MRTLALAALASLATAAHLSGTPNPSGVGNGDLANQPARKEPSLLEARSFRVGDVRSIGEGCNKERRNVITNVFKDCIIVARLVQKEAKTGPNTRIKNLFHKEDEETRNTVSEIMGRVISIAENPCNDTLHFACSGYSGLRSGDRPSYASLCDQELICKQFGSNPETLRLDFQPKFFSEAATSGMVEFCDIYHLERFDALFFQLVQQAIYAQFPDEKLLEHSDYRKPYMKAIKDTRRGESVIKDATIHTLLAKAVIADSEDPRMACSIVH